MHFEILVEDQSGKKMLECIIPKIINSEHTYKIISYKGIGHIPRDMRSTDKAFNRILLENLPKLLKGYGNSFSGYDAAIIVVCDLDDKCLKEFKAQLNNILDQCEKKPETRFCIAIEEGEAWLLGDINAVVQAYPNAKNKILNEYVYDSICGTWEYLADAVYSGGANVLKRKGYQAIGSEKYSWAANISPRIDITQNLSPSFKYFCRKISELATK